MQTERITTNRLQRWTELANDYESFVEPFTRQHGEVALTMVGEIGPGTQVLNVAAGARVLSVPAAQAGVYPDCVARLMDGQHIDTPDGAFDAAFSMFGVMTFPDWRQGLRELARATRKDGHGCLAAWRDSLNDGPIRFLTRAHSFAFPNGPL